MTSRRTTPGSNHSYPELVVPRCFRRNLRKQGKGEDVQGELDASLASRSVHISSTQNTSVSDYDAVRGNCEQKSLRRKLTRRARLIELMGVKLQSLADVVHEVIEAVIAGV